MSERNHSQPAEHAANEAADAEHAVNPAQRKRRLTLMVAGAVVAALAAGVAFQVFRAEPGEAGIQPGAQRQGGQADVKRPWARVNGQLIGWNAVAEECMARYGKDVLENIINRTIIAQACEKRGVVVTNAEVTAEVIRIARKFNLAPDAWYQMLQTERNLTPVQYRRDIIWPMLALRKLAGKDVTVTQRDMQRTFRREYGERVECRMIMLDNLRRAQQIQAMAQRDPAQFGRLARKHSIEPTSRALDGAIPPIRQFSHSPSIEKAAFGLGKGEVSGVIQTKSGRLVILLCEGRTKPVVTSIDEVKDQLYGQIKEEKTQEMVAKVFESLRKEARVDNYKTNVRIGGELQTPKNKAVQPAGYTQPAGRAKVR